ncbi:hypothetical protein ASPZODRAFT_14505 [Penicilliopsis zonata CBS 506.65]|uniref:Zinc finger PHD-type domain-containing protein n=1 Tax=Penicilliopsis zonata CBS 506.65 TaxID=1073090 RepID=A0A1L9SMA7_9EURO|nr:hypothetical protein ASPZODRAFT_14505 [Penicilliopsis zonata CBS 506.65]OJJ48365.1 hypothetical protein ASPZODRAFT_14505 [Penicilliopsis zonata CBS 506.65]
MTPRRSSRARTQPSPAILQHTNSSSSSGSLTRERNTRSNHKNPSPQRPSVQRSQSIDGVEGNSKMDFPHTRQRQRTRSDEQNPLLAEGEDDEDEDAEEEEEITRCLCKQQDYPGLPPSRYEGLLGRRGAASGIKDETAANTAGDPLDPLSDDIGSMFIQCDRCKVWQHGGCVGIMDEAMSPDEYFCEECRKDLHRIKHEADGRLFSQYLPVAPPSPAVSSRASSRDNSRAAREPKTRNNDTGVPPKRRSTMNSREAAYDEEEQLRRAIEESKEDTKITTEDLASRRAKRSRSDSEANRQASKRPRTSSPSPTAASKQSNPASQPVSEDESKTKLVTNGAKKPRPIPRTQRDKESKDIEEAELEHAESNRRKVRTERRKGDESDHETASPAKTLTIEPEPPQPSPETPVLTQESAPSRPSTRKSGRPAARRGGRVGRNQYTRDRDTNGTDSYMANSPRRGQSLDTGADSPRLPGANGTYVNGGESGKPSRPRYMNPQRTTMNDMKRRVAGILEFISRMQVEMAAAGGSSPPGASGGEQQQQQQPNGNSNSDSNRNSGFIKHLAEQMDGILTGSEADTSSLPGGSGERDSSENNAEKPFTDLTSLEMMDVLTRHLLKWQQEYGKYGEK